MVFCDVCGEDCEWLEDDNGKWRLYDSEGEIHSHGRCKNCGDDCLWKKNDDDEWRLYDDDEPHRCLL